MSDATPPELREEAARFHAAALGGRLFAIPDPQHCAGCICRPEHEARPAHPDTQIGRLNR